MTPTRHGLRVIVADDQAVVRDGLVLLLSTAPDVDVVGVAGTGVQAVEMAVRLRPDVVLSDLRMPELDGAGVAAALAEQLPEVKVLILTTFADDDAILPALRAGALGYLTKDATGEELLSAVRAVAAGRTVLDPSVQARLVALLVSGTTSAGRPAWAPPSPPRPAARSAHPDAPSTPPAAPQPPQPEVEGLTRREVDVVRLVAAGLSNGQVARRLVISEATVKTHLNHVLAKLAVDGRAGLVAWAWRHGVVNT